MAAANPMIEGTIGAKIDLGEEFADRIGAPNYCLGCIGERQNGSAASDDQFGWGEVRPCWRAIARGWRITWRWSVARHTRLRHHRAR